MGRFEKLLGFVKKQRGHGVTLRSEGSAILLSERGQQKLNLLMTVPEMEALLREVLPAGQEERLNGSESFTFPYFADVEYQVAVTRPQGKLEITIGPPAQAAPAAEPPPVAEPETAAEPESPAPPPPGPAAPVVPVAQPVAPPKILYPPEYLPNLFRIALDCRASDVHLRPGSLPRFRINGQIQISAVGGLLSHEQLHAALSELVPMHYRRGWRERGAAEFCVTFESRARVRCALFQERTGVAASCRLLPVEPPALAELSLPGVAAELTRLERGLVVVAGLRATGLSTTLAALAQAVNAERRANLVTVESPVEYLLRPNKSLVTQVEIPTHAPTYAEALRRLLHADVDVCAVADLTEPEALAAALAAAETGMLILGALRRPDVPAVVEHLIDTLGTRGPGHSAERVTRALAGVVCQRLVKPKRVSDRLIPVFEVLTANAHAAYLIAKGRIRELHGNLHMTFTSALLHLLKADKITIAEALNQAPDSRELRELSEKARGGGDW